MKERAPKFVREVREKQGEQAFLDMSKRGGIAAGAKSSQEAAARRHYKEKRKTEIDAAVHEHVRIENGDVLPPENPLYD